MRYRILLSLVAIVFIAAACNKQTKPADTNNTNQPGSDGVTGNELPIATPTPTPTPTPTKAPVAQSAVVKATGSAFEPVTLTIKKGTKVTFQNTSSKPVWPASAPHPVHTNYPEFDAKKGIAAGSSWEFTFDKVGTWAYHDHLNSAVTGKVIVTE